MGIGHFGQNEPKSGPIILAKAVEIFSRGRAGGPPRVVDPPPHAWGPPPPRVGDPLPVGDPPPSRGPLFFSLTPHSPTCDMGLFWTPHYTPPSPTCDMGLFSPNALQIWPQKVPLGPFWRSNLVPWQATGGASIAPPRGRDEHWHHEYTLRKGLTWPDSPLAQ